MSPPTPTAQTSINLAPTEKPLTNADGNASEIQIKQLKEVLKKLLEVKPELEETISAIAVETNGFTVISKADCEQLTVWAGGLIKGEK